MSSSSKLDVLERIADALDRLAPETSLVHDLDAADAFVWHGESSKFEPVFQVNRVDLKLLKGVKHQASQLLANTKRFANFLPANNALLWGARGTGKSSLVKAVHATINEQKMASLCLIEIHREDLQFLSNLLQILRSCDRQCIIFCDDLSFDISDSSYKALKTMLEGGIEGRPKNILFYATSNRRHLMPRDMIENETSTSINPNEAVDEKVSLSDRFGLWLGFHTCDQKTYFDIVQGYADFFQLKISPEDLRAQAMEWSITRGSCSGRVAWQFIQDLAGILGKKIE